MKNKTTNEPIWLTIAGAKDGWLIISQRYYYPDRLVEEMADCLDLKYGAGNWAIIPTTDLPEDFDPTAYTVIDGQLVPASAELLAERRSMQEHAAARQEKDNLLRHLAETDYVALKFAEGAITPEAYEPTRQQRAAWRARINEIEARITKLNVDGGYGTM